MNLSHTVNTYNFDHIIDDFPVLNQEVNGHRLIYFDNAATTQKPKSVLNSLQDYYQGFNSNIHRGAHNLADRATSAFEDTRKSVKEFINANEEEEIVFTYGTTDGINLIASTFGRSNLNAGDEIIISTMEHHSNIVPWQMLCEEKGAKLKVIPIDENGDLILEEFDNLLSERTKIVSIVHVSNSLGTINDISYIINKAHQFGATVVVDGAQASAHINIDVRKLGCDFYVFSGHKVFGPTGVGILYGKRSLLENMPPYRGGGEMIKDVTFEKTTYNDIPYKFEAGTPNIADVIALKKALEFVKSFDAEQLQSHEQLLLDHLTASLKGIEGIRIIGEANRKIGVVSFVHDNLHPFDIGMMLDAKGIAVRTGHHCTQPLMDFLKIEGTVRASLSIYNTMEEIDIFSETLSKITARWK
jgi:cysteine desulfurase/selenocysteine lyase